MRTAEAKPVSVAEAKSLFKNFERLSTLVLAVSGGPDSTALMVLAARWAVARKHKPKLVAVTVDHGLRPESKKEARAVGELARALGIEHRTMRWSGEKPTTGLQEAARRARYRLLSKAARAVGAHHIVTAHTLDDQAETVLIRLARGSGVTGLGAMRKELPLPLSFAYPSLERAGTDRRRRSGEASAKNIKEKPLYLVRPFLDVPKSRLIATLRAAKVSFADDPSNRDPRFTRVRLRELMPVLAQEGLGPSRLALLARRLRRADHGLEVATEQACASLVRRKQDGAAVIASSAFAALPSEIGLRLLGRALGWVATGPVALGKLETLKEGLDVALAAEHPRFRRSLAGALVTFARAEIVIEQAPPRRRGKS